MTTPFLSIRSIAKRYGDVVAVEDVSLDIRKGEFVTFLGPSGSGKSTTLYIIAGFEAPSVGDVLLNGASLLSAPPNKRQIGMVFQRYTLFPHLSVADNVGFPLKVRRRSKADIDAKVSAMLKLVRLEAYADRAPSKLSGGQQQRVALARALAYDPPLLLMDEPLSALDKKLREELQFEIKRIHNETGVTILYVTHDQEEALRLSDRVVLFNHGRIEQIGSGRELFDAPSTHFVASFMGNSNFLAGEVTKTHGQCVEVALPDGSLVSDIPAAGFAIGDKVSMMVRHDRIALAGAEEQPSPIKLAATVVASTFLGDVIHVVARTGWGEEISLRRPCDGFVGELPQTGELVRLVWSTASTRLYAKP